jgi:hypothetical protein
VLLIEALGDPFLWRDAAERVLGSAADRLGTPPLLAA